MRDWLQNLRPAAAGAIVVWAALASAVAVGAIATAHRVQAENLRLTEEIALRDRTDFMVELDECAHTLLATRSLLADRLDWMALHHLRELRAFGEDIRANEDEGFDFLDVHERKVWEREAQRINGELSRRGVPPLRVR